MDMRTSVNFVDLGDGVHTAWICAEFLVISTSTNWKLFNMILCLFIAVTAIKLLLIPAYHSTDLEVHRNWLAITNSLPISEWYTEATSEWTLDYPPLFAWFQLFLSYPAKLADPNMLMVNNLNYKSSKSIIYLRLTVILSDLVLAYGVKECSSYLSSSGVRKSSKWSTKWYSPSTVLKFLLLANVGLILVDHIHFQYNGILFGLLLLSIASLLKGDSLAAAFYFVVLLNMKHIFLYIAPAYFIYLLRNDCFTTLTPGFLVRPSQFARAKFLQLCAIVIAVFILSFGPFLAYGQLGQIIGRLFPFKRGLSHAYWAPNLWALYSTLDKILETSLRGVGLKVPSSSITSGLVEDAEFAVLPHIPPSVTFLLTAAFAAPCLIKLWRYPGNPMHFLRCLVLCALTSFLFGWHVHEKAILLAIVPLSLMAVIWQREARLFLLLSITGYYSLLPLIPPGLETPIKFSLLILHVIYSISYLAYLFDEEIKTSLQLPLLSKLESLYIIGLIPLAALTHLVMPIFFPRLQFLPLLLTSAYCAIGVTYCWGSYYCYFLTKHEENHKRKLH